MSETTEEQIADLLRVLAAAPAAWVERAQEIPRRERERSDHAGLLALTDEDDDG